MPSPSKGVRHPSIAEHPELSTQWHPTMNEGLDPAAITLGSTKRVWWVCPDDSAHVWQTPVRVRLAGSGCPMCANERLRSAAFEQAARRRASPRVPAQKKSLAQTHPELAAQWHPTRNGILTPENVTQGSGLKVWWRCPRDQSHEWQTVVCSRTGNGTGCPMCAGKRVSADNSLAARFPDLAKQWHPTKNRTLTPADVLAMSHRKVWWQCPENPSHAWRASCAHRAHSGQGCPYCCGHKALRKESLGVLHPALAREWHPTLNGKLTPFDVRADAWTEPWWLCPEGADHIWRVAVRRRAQGIGGCPFCVGRKASSSTSLDSHCPDLAAQWHPTRNGLALPRDFLVMDERAVWWRCEKGHAWLCRVDARVVLGQSCPRCEEQLRAREQKRERARARRQMAG